MVPAVAAALVQGGSAIGSGLLDLFGAADTNKANLQIARETNQQNRELFNQQLAWQEDMWNKTNAYNDPSHQVELLQKAGINPAAVYGNGSTSPASMPSVPSANPMQSASVSPLDYSFISQGIDSGINAYFENQLKNNYVKKSFSDAQIADINAQFETRTLMDRCMRVANDTSKSEFERETARMELKFLTSTFDQRVMQSEWSTKIMFQQYDDLVNKIAESKLRQKAQEIANEFAPRANAAQLKQYQASISQMYAAARNQDAQAAESAAREALTQLGIKEKDSLLDPLIEKAWNEAENSYWQSQQTGKMFRLGNLGTYAPGGNTDGRSYTNYATKYRSREKGRVYRDKQGNRVHGQRD